MKTCIKNLFPLPALIAGLSLILAGRVAAQTPNGMALIPAGSFTMGNSTGDSDITDATPTSIYVSAFYMDTNAVSYSEWQAVYNWATSHGYSFDYAGAGKAANHPVQTVDWYDTVKWCNARSQQAGLTPAYYTDAGLTQVYTTGQVPPYVNWAAKGYRLPTEAEWEKAARGGSSGQRFPWGNTISESQANYYGDKADYSYDLGPNGYNAAFATGGYPYTSPVGSFAANGYGLYDMAGNVWEWCWDWYGTSLGQPTTTNPTGPATGSKRVLRGGCWTNDVSITRCAARIGSAGNPTSERNSGGFRCVRAQLQVTTVVLSAPQVAVGKTNFTFLLTGPAGSNYVLQVSTNLVNWSSVSTSTMPVSGSITLSNAISGYSRRFYRAYLQ
jgi:formylglycine-generating enzyme required for sulfatase activity